MTSAATIDLSAVDALSADELTAQIALADVVFARVRINDPRMSSLAYSDAKLVVQVLTAERRRREELAAIAAAEAIVAEAMTDICPPSCKAALSHSSLCECRCRGEHHGTNHRAAREQFMALTTTRTDRRPDGFTNAILAQLDDEAF